MKDTLCNNHNSVIFDIDLCIKTLKHKDFDPNYVINTLKIAKNKVKYCKKQGQRMENRLYKYRKSIEELGFERTKHE